MHTFCHLHPRQFHSFELFTLPRDYVESGTIGRSGVGTGGGYRCFFLACRAHLFFSRLRKKTFFVGRLCSQVMKPNATGDETSYLPDLGLWVRCQKGCESLLLFEKKMWMTNQNVFGEGPISPDADSKFQTAALGTSPFVQQTGQHNDSQSTQG